MTRINEPGELIAERSVQECADRSHFFGPLRDAILQDPEDDAPRLVYADACGDERGELIVTQCALAAGDDREALVRRDIELLAAHGERWFGGLGPFDQLVVHRGFGERLALPAGALQISEALAREPIRHLVIEGRAGERYGCTTTNAELLCALQRPGTERLRRLELPPHTDHDTLRIVGGATRLAGLRALHIPHPWLGDADLAPFVRDSALANLEELRIGAGAIGRLHRSLAQLRFPRLHRLALRGQKLSAAAMLVLASSDAFARIEALDLRDNPELTRTALEALLAGPRLHSLGLAGSVGRDQMSGFVRAPGSARLVQLDLSDTLAQNFVDLLGAATMPALLDLDLGYERGKGHQPAYARFEALWQAPWLTQLETLRLDGRAIGDAGLAMLLARPLPRLRTLTIANCALTEEAVLPLRAAALPALEVLDLTENPRLTQAVGRALAEAPWLRQLRALRSELPIEAPGMRVREIRVAGKRPPRIRARSLAPPVWPARRLLGSLST